MWRYFVGGGAALLLAVAGMFLFRGSASPESPLPPAPRAAVSQETDAPLPDQAPRASDKTREQKRFDRYDKDRNDAISREEYLASRRKAFAKLDANGDGRLAFEEWAGKTIEKFTGADGDKSATLTRAEFATTAPKRRPAAPRARCACTPAPERPTENGED